MRDDRQRPHFYVRAADAERARTLRMPPAQLIDSRTFAGEPVARVEVEVPTDVPPLRDRLHAAGIDTFEADVRFAVRYLIERGIKGGCEIEGPATAGKGVTLDLRQSGAASGRRDRRTARAGVRHRDRCERRASARDLDVRAGTRRSVDRRQRPAADAGEGDPLRQRVRGARRILRASPRARLRRASRAGTRSTSISRCCSGSLCACAIRWISAATPRRCGCASPKAISAAARRRSPDAWCWTASTCCAAHSSAWTTTRSTPSRAKCWAKARRSRATCATASARSCTTIVTTCPHSRCMRAPMRDSRIRSSRS